MVAAFVIRKAYNTAYASKLAGDTLTAAARCSRVHGRYRKHVWGTRIAAAAARSGANGRFAEERAAGRRLQSVWRGHLDRR